MTLSQLGRGAGNYYLSISNEDYYREGGESPGVWFGAEKFLLRGKVEDRALRRMLDGYEPRLGGKLVQNAGSKKRVPGWDLCFSAPKSVSIAWALGSDELRQVVLDAHDAAVREALVYAREKLFVVRVGKAGAKRVPADAIPVALFRHGTSRAQDMQLHTHALVLNVGMLEDLSTKALEPKRVYEAQKTLLGPYYRQALAAKLQARGLELRRTRDAFELRVVPAAMLTLFSERNRVIRQKRDELGINSAAAMDRLVKSTRQKKGHVAWSVLQRAWRKRAQEFNLSTLRLPSEQPQENTRRAPPTTQQAREQEARGERVAGSSSRPARTRDSSIPRHATRSGEQAAAEILDRWRARGAHPSEPSAGDDTHLRSTRQSMQGAAPSPAAEDRVRKIAETAFQCESEERTRFSEETVLARCLEMARGKPIANETLREAIRGVFDERGADFTGATSSVVQRSLDAAKAWATNLSTRNERLGEKLVSKVSARHRLSREQRDALSAISKTQGQILLLDGHAGTGKTQVARAAARGLQASGHKVIGTASTQSSALALMDNGAKNCVSMNALLHKLEEGFLARSRRILTSLQNGDKVELRPGKKSVVIVDDAQGLRPGQLERLAWHAKQRGFTLLLVGDSTRDRRMEGKSSFSMLCAEVPGSRIELREQKRNPSIAKGLRELAEGHHAEGRRELLRGRTRVAKSESQSKEALVQKWLADRQVSKSLVLAASQHDVGELNKLIQMGRKSRGQLGRGSVNVAGERFYTGDRIVLRDDHKSLGLRAGDIGTIRRIGFMRASGNRPVEILFDRKEKAAGWLPRERHLHASFLMGGFLKDEQLARKDAFELAYASTPGASQGREVDNAYIYLDESGLERESLLHMSSRATKSIEYFAAQDCLQELEAYLDDAVSVKEAQRVRQRAVERGAAREDESHLAQEREERGYE